MLERARVLLVEFSVCSLWFCSPLKHLSLTVWVHFQPQVISQAGCYCI